MRVIISDFSTASRKEFSESYGTWFSKSVDPKELIVRCDEQLQNCKNWINNLQQLKEEAQKMLLDKCRDEAKLFFGALSKEELRSCFDSLTKEEREEFLNN